MQAPFEVRPVESAEFDEFLEVATSAFGAPIEPEEWELDHTTLERDRCLAAFDGSKVVGATAAFSLTLTVPGGAVPTAGVTAVGVAPTHRRRGVATELLTRQLRDVAAGEEPLAALWASEDAIYGRYGYGAAALCLRLSIERDRARVDAPSEAGRLRLADPAAARPEIEPVYDAVRRERPGYYSRGNSTWQMRLFDPEKERGGRTPLRCVLHEDGAGAVDGYLLYATKPGWHDGRPEGEVDVREVVAETPAAYAALWRFLLGLDLMAHVQAHVALDDPLLALLSDRRAARARLADNLWVRIADVGRALSARSYAAPLDVVLRVDDALLPANTGCWRLAADADGAECARTTAAPDLSLQVRELGAAYLGGPSLGALAAAGLVGEHRPGALVAASAAFGWHRQPFCPQVF